MKKIIGCVLIIIVVCLLAGYFAGIISFSFAGGGILLAKIISMLF